MPAANSSANSSCMSLSRAPLEKVVCQVTVASGPLFVVAWLIVARCSTSRWLAPSDARLIHLFDRGCNFGRQKPV